MEVLGFIFGLSAATFAIIGFGATGHAMSRIKALQGELEELKSRLAALESQGAATADGNSGQESA